MKLPTEKLLEILVDEEEKVRNSEYYRNLCNDVKDIPNGWLTVTSKIQNDIVSKYFDNPIECEIACNKLRRAQYEFPDNEKFKRPLYVRNNKASVGKFKINDELEDVVIYDMEKTAINMSSIICEDKFNLIFSGSET
jgi:hypothetical protein